MTSGERSRSQGLSKMTIKRKIVNILLIFKQKGSEIECLVYDIMHIEEVR